MGFRRRSSPVDGSRRPSRFLTSSSPILERQAGGDQRQQLRRVQLPPRRLGDPEHLPDDGLGSLHALVAAGRVRAETHRGERGFHDVRRP